MTELQKRAKEYLISKGVKKTGDKFIALEVMDLLCEFVQIEQLNIGGVVKQSGLLACKGRCRFLGVSNNVF